MTYVHEDYVDKDVDRHLKAADCYNKRFGKGTVHFQVREINGILRLDLSLTQGPVGDGARYWNIPEKTKKICDAAVNSGVEVYFYLFNSLGEYAGSCIPYKESDWILAMTLPGQTKHYRHYHP